MSPADIQIACYGGSIIRGDGRTAGFSKLSFVKNTSIELRYPRGLLAITIEEISLHFRKTCLVLMACLLHESKDIPRIDMELKLSA